MVTSGIHHETRSGHFSPFTAVWKHGESCRWVLGLPTPSGRPGISFLSPFVPCRGAIVQIISADFVPPCKYLQCPKLSLGLWELLGYTTLNYMRGEGYITGCSSISVVSKLLPRDHIWHATRLYLAHSKVGFFVSTFVNV